MQKGNINIALGLFLVLSAGLIYLSFGLDNKTDYRIDKIELEGNTYLSQEDYFKYADLDKEENLRHLTLSLIRDRIQKHPYAETVTVEYEGEGIVKVHLKEKKLKALILTKKTKYLLTKDVEVLPFIENTHNIDYPVIRMNEKDKSLIPFTFPKSNLSIAVSYKILSAAKLMNPSLYNNLSEVDLRNGSNVVLYFSSVDYPVILGKENEIKKMVLFEKLWESLSTVQASKLLDYVDLRFKDKVYIGLAGENLQVEETQS